MLQFWKKSGSKDKSKTTPPPSPVRNACSEETSATTNGALRKTCTHEKLLSQLCEEEGDILSTNEVMSCHSRLSLSLAEVIADKGALGYFIQFMEVRDVGPLIRFWLDVESFRSAAAAELSNTSRSKTILSKCGVNSSQSDTSCTSDHDSTFESQHSELTHVRNSEKRTNDNKVVTVSSEQSTPEHKSDNGAVSECSVEKDDWTGVEEQDIDRRYDSEGQDRHSVNSASIWNDAVRIYEKYLAPNATHRVTIPDATHRVTILNECKDSLARAISSEGDIDPDCFLPAQRICYETMENEHFNEFLRSEFYCKHQIDVLTSGDISLTDILYNQTSLFYFMEFMEQEGQQSLVEFWLAATNFQSNIIESGNTLNPDEIQSDAIILYERYFSLQATCPLGFGDKVRIEIEHNICREGGPSAICFQKPLLLIIRLLEKNYFQMFLQSQLYVKYLSELVNTIQACPSLLTRHRKSGSDCSSDICVSMQNTLLASSDLAPPRKGLKNVHRSLSVDSKQLYNPDSLWSRREHSGLSFGRINELGRFETEVEPEPDRKNESRFTKAMKKLVNMEEDKAKEEMAWQIAAMIVKDVTSVTLSEQSISS